MREVSFVCLENVYPFYHFSTETDRERERERERERGSFPAKLTDIR
jgi:hypothetical protein